MREAQWCVAEVRHELVGADTTAPIVNLERFRWRTVLSAIALTVAAFILIGQLSKVDLLGALSHTNLGWFAIAIVASAFTYFAAAENLAAFVPKHLSALRGFLVQLSTAFVGLAMPPTVGHVAVNARYLARQKVDAGAITAAVAISQIVNVVTTVLLLDRVRSSHRLWDQPLQDRSEHRLVDRPGRHRFGRIRSFSSCRRLGRGSTQPYGPAYAVSGRTFWTLFPSRRALALGIIANLSLTLSYVIAFVASLEALGAHPALLPAAIVYLAGNTVGSAAPTPGGLGAVEAVLSAGLTAIGVPAHQAIPAVLIFRVATFWLPIPAGWISYLALTRSGTL